jgi:hypothetical protein
LPFSIFSKFCIRFTRRPTRLTLNGTTATYCWVDAPALTNDVNRGSEVGTDNIVAMTNIMAESDVQHDEYL